MRYVPYEKYHILPTVTFLYLKGFFCFIVVQAMANSEFTREYI
jgi:hypothetical protein